MRQDDPTIRLYEHDWMVMRILVPAPREIIREIGLARFLWGYDIFIGRVPFLKSILLGNLLFLAAMTWLMRGR